MKHINKEELLSALNQIYFEYKQDKHTLSKKTCSITKIIII
jgi:hypothetical protein